MWFPYKWVKSGRASYLVAPVTLDGAFSREFTSRRIWEKGVFLINFAGCFQCKENNRAPDSIKVRDYSKENIVEEDDDDLTKEIITFERE